ncbi:unnamed protein product [Rhizoctonia solani]|uniref:Major facilitator superfamily (MFS) profile domain-containing protein n=1 Tax=Rhizoctonia solani TaxID=456999 RepID=A0A8H3D5N9_9AGAM|nr:unnamed protein product [Rhizoctonia solani]
MSTSQSSVEDVQPRSPGPDVPEPPQLTPVPKLQVVSVCVSRIAESFDYNQIFPYVNEMVWRLGITDDPKKVGFYSGMLDSMFAFSQLVVVYGYGALSDRIGRKPVVLFSVFGLAFSSGIFGLSTTFAHMLVARTIAGLLSGYVAVLHSILAEITDSTNQAAVYPMYALCYPIGLLIGPLVGGALANPNQSIPHLVPAFLHDLFDKYPYLLPSATACMVTILSLIFTFFFMKETLPSAVRRKTCGSSGTQRADSLQSALPRAGIESKKHSSETDLLLATNEEQVDPPRSWTATELLKLPQLRQLYRASIILSFLSEAHGIVFVLFSHTRIQYGGLGFEPTEIGVVLATAGSISLALQLLVLPVVLHRAKPTKAFEICMSLWPIGYAIPPVLNVIARASSGNGQRPIGTAASVAIWAGIWVAQLLTKIARMAYSLNMVMVRETAPDQRALGTTNGLNLFFMSGARMFAPITINTLFSLSIQHNWLGGHFVWVVMVVLSVLGWKACAWD